MNGINMNECYLTQWNVPFGKLWTWTSSFVMTAATFSSLYQGCYDLECHRYQAPEMTQRLLIDVKDMEKLSADHAFVVIRQHSVGKTVIPHMWLRASCLVKKT